MLAPLEDLYTDVLGKARRGLRLSESQLAQKAGVGLEALEAFQGGKLDDADCIARIARALELHAPALLDLARSEWTPGEIALPPTAMAYNTPYGDDMTVNCYLAWDESSGRAAAFDTGANCQAMLQTLRAKRLTLDAVFLTHTHEDHVADLDRLLAETDAPLYVSRLEPVGGATLIEDGQEFAVGGLTVTSRLTSGHSPGGTTYVVTGFTPGVAVVGDALFAGSIGGVAPEKYAAAIAANRAQILSLPEDTVICPGHGPLSTVELERKHNPFFAAGEAKA